jgi:hypothetical protein
MQQFNRAECRRRRFSMLGRCLIGAFFALIGINNGNLFFAVGGLVIAIHAIVLLFYPEELMDVPGTFFPEIIPDEYEIVVSSSVMQRTAKRCAGVAEPLMSPQGVWDRELDGVR